MRKLILFVILLIGIVICLAPWVDGYLFKKIYYQQVALLAQQIEGSNKNMQVKVQSYDMGWMSSVANLTISSDHPSFGKPIIFNVKSIIHHGPLVYADNKLQLAYAVIDTSIYLPDMLKQFVPAQTQGFMQIHSSVALNGNTWTHHYIIPAIASNLVNWGGLSGDVVLDTVNGDPVKVTSSLTIGKLSVPAFMPSLPEFTVLPIKSSFNATQQALHVWNGNGDSNMGGIFAKWQDGSSFSMKNIIRNSIYNVSSGLGSFNTKISIESMQFPASFPVSNLAKISFSFAINQLNLADISQHYKEYSRAIISEKYDPLLNILTASINILTATTTTDMKMEMNSDLGAASASLHGSLTALPKTENKISYYVNADLNVRVAQPLVEKIVESELQGYAKKQSPPITADLPKQAKMILDAVMQQGYIQQDKNDYVISFSRKGTASVLNGKVMNDNDLSMIMGNIDKIVNQVIAPVVVAPVKRNVVALPVVKPIVYQCYWMDSSTGKSVWKLVNSASKMDCYNLDSCSGGLAQSAGGCYKWAASADANGMPWDAPVPVH